MRNSALKTLTASSALALALAGCATGGDKVETESGVQLVEEGDPREVLANPQHERTQAFLSKVL